MIREKFFSPIKVSRWRLWATNISAHCSHHGSLWTIVLLKHLLGLLSRERLEVNNTITLSFKMLNHDRRLQMWMTTSSRFWCGCECVSRNSANSVFLAFGISFPSATFDCIIDRKSFYCSSIHFDSAPTKLASWTSRFSSHNKLFWDFRCTCSSRYLSLEFYL